MHDELEQLYRRYYPVIEAKCERLMQGRADAQDIAQESFARLWRNRAEIDDAPQSGLRWLYRTSTHLCVDRLRRRTALPHFSLFEEPDAPSVDLDSRLDARDFLQKAAAALEPEQLEALILIRIDRMTHRQAAELMEVSERTVRRWLTRASATLAQLRQEDIDDDEP